MIQSLNVDPRGWSEAETYHFWLIALGTMDCLPQSSALTRFCFFFCSQLLRETRDFMNVV